MPFDTPITRMLGRLQLLVIQNRIRDFVPVRHKDPHRRGSYGGSQRWLISGSSHRRGRLWISDSRYDYTPRPGKTTDLCNPGRLQERQESDRRFIPCSWITQLESLGPPSNWRRLSGLAVGGADGRARGFTIGRPRQQCPRNLACVWQQSQAVDQFYSQL